MRKTILYVLLLFVLLSAGCATDGTTPYVPVDVPTQEELDHLLGNWSGLSETTNGLLDKVDLSFYEYNENVLVSIYLNDTYIYDAHVEYDGDNIRFSSYNITGDFGEFDGVIDHVQLIFTGTFYYQSGISFSEGTFVIDKL